MQHLRVMFFRGRLNLSCAGIGAFMELNLFFLRRLTVNSTSRVAEVYRRYRG